MRFLLPKNLRTLKESPYAFGIALVLVFALLSFAIIYTHAPRPGSTTFSKAYETTLSDYDGKPVLFDHYRGKPLIVYFWASWCAYCNTELAHLSALKGEYGNRINILAVNRGESRADAKAFTDPLHITGLVLLLDSGDNLFKELRGYAMPETIFINSRGEVILQQHGPLAPADADSALAALLR